jgi:hypothetical protein
MYMSTFKWAALAAATVVALVAVAAPGAESARNPGLKITTAVATGDPDPSQGVTLVARCPKGYSVVGGGFGGSVAFTPTIGVRHDDRSYVVRDSPTGLTPKAQKRTGKPVAEAICAKGTGGFNLSDDGSGI